MQTLSSLPKVSRRTLIMGDLHGARAALRKGMEVARPSAADRIVSLGDLVGRGPESAGVVEEMRQIQRDFPETKIVGGNHDEKHGRVWRLQQAGDTARLRQIKMDHHGFRETHAQLSDEQLSWLGGLPLIERLEPDFVAVHAGIPPQISDPLEVLNQIPTKNRHKILRVLTYLHPTTLEPYKFEEDQSRGIFWADVYNGRYGYLAFGHQVHRRPTRYPWALALDTGCGWGGHLSILELLPGESATRIFSISTQDLSVREERFHEPEPACRPDLKALTSGVVWD